VVSFVRTVRRAVKAIIPEAVRERMHFLKDRQWDARFKNQSAATIFAAVYYQERWGKGPAGDFYSGDGSHDREVVLPYFEAVSAFLESFPERPSVVDLGCGDFNIGIQIRPPRQNVHCLRCRS
jgi:hypothetical protein